jgi:hypothetical protein
MATWIAHMRIAEHFMNKDNSLNNPYFLVGNIGPDCGVPNEDWSKFTPDKDVTHWTFKDGKTIDADDFKQKYLVDIDERFPFYLGYYFHLITDIEWKKKFESTYSQYLEKDKSFIWTIKEDWYGQDHLFLRNNPKSIFFTMFSKITEFDNLFFDFYPTDAFIRQVNYITGFYLSYNKNLDRDFPYLSKSEMDEFVVETIKVLENINLIKDN